MNTTQHLVDAKGLLEALFDEKCRPTVRWVRLLQKRKAIPFYKMGKLIFFNVEEVRSVILGKSVSGGLKAFISPE